MSDLVGRKLGRYEIVKLLGAGGMGEVYLAKDTQLGRQVAVKVLVAKAAGDPARRARFEKEARAVALLSHPNILDIHDFGVDGEVAYTVTELLEGHDLRHRMGGSALPVSKALEIGRAVAEGLAAAHGKGIVHRDIKPENIFITPTGQVKILDFGIASLVAEEFPDVRDPNVPTATSPVTAQVMGTVGYMSPEQVRGQPVDARSDIFSLGCVLYELVTGKRAFYGETPTDTLLAILDRDPPPIAASRTDVPPALESVIHRCLEKQPGERFDSAHDVAFALQAVSLVREAPVRGRLPGARAGSRTIRVGLIALAGVVVAALAVLGVRRFVRGAPPLPGEKHLGVARFEAEGSVAGLQEIATGLTEEVRRGLSLLEEAAPGDLWVVARADTEKPGLAIKGVADFGRKFNATAVVTGLVRRSGDRLRLELAIVDPTTLAKLRQSQIEDSVSNLSAFQEEPFLRVARLLELQVSPEARQRLKGTATTMTAAFEAYVNGIGILADAKDDQSCDRAIALLEKAVSRDPLFTAARVALGRAYLRKFELSKKAEWSDRAVAAGERAVAESAWPAEAYLLLAAANASAGRAPEALATLQRAERVAPASAAVHLELAAAYQGAKRFADAEQAIQRAVFLQPGYWPPHNMLARLYQAQGKYESAATEDREVIACAPLLPRGYNALGAMYHYVGRDDDARAAFERAVALEPTRSALSNLGTLYYGASRFADAAAMFERALELDKTLYLTWGNLAWAYHYGPTPAKAEACFRRAAELAEKQHRAAPNDQWVMAYLAGYYAMLGQREKGLALLAEVVKQAPAEKELIALVAESFEDLGERARALEWVARSFEAGESPSRFEGQPTLRALVADEGYRRLAAAVRRNP